MDADDIVLRRLPQRHRVCPDIARRVVRAQSLVQLAGLSAGRQALEGRGTRFDPNTAGTLHSALVGL